MPPSQVQTQFLFLRRAALWFAFAYFALQLHGSILEALPGASGVAEWLTEARWSGVAWLLERWFGIAIEHFPAGSGDTTYNWLESALFAFVAAFAALVAAAFDRAEAGQARRRYALETLLRFGLASAMLLYGFAKVFPSQFAPLTIDRLATPIGDASPMGLLWAFMRYSRGYQLFTGMAEVAAGALLLSRRTTPLGAFLSAAAMANVVALNICYDVPVKLYSSHLLAVALLLAAPDAWRLMRFCLLRRGEPLAPVEEPFPTPRGRAIRVAAEAALGLAIVAGAVLASTAEDAEAMLAFSTPEALVGLYAVEGATSDAPAPAGWLRLALGDAGSGTLIGDDQRARHLTTRRADDGEGATFHFSDAEPRVVYVVRSVDDDEAIVSAPDGATVARLRRLPTPRFLLLERGFHLVTERTFHR